MVMNMTFPFNSEAAAVAGASAVLAKLAEQAAVDEVEFVCSVYIYIYIYIQQHRLGASGFQVRRRL